MVGRVFEKHKGLDRISAVLELLLNFFKLLSVILDTWQNICAHYDLYKHFKLTFNYLFSPLFDI